LKVFLNLNPDNKPIDKSKIQNIDSNIITFQHAELISKWIDKTDKLASPYEFKLMLCGSRDGFSNCKFHEICDGKSKIVTIVKLKDSSKILGGYNPVGWKSDVGYSITKDSFIFSFENSDSVENCILSRVVKEDYAIYNDHFYGPCFGNRDLILYGRNCYNWSYCRSSQYEKLIIEDGDEVFQITKIND
jgi:hypothetical protein